MSKSSLYSKAYQFYEKTVPTKYEEYKRQVPFKITEQPPDQIHDQIHDQIPDVVKSEKIKNTSNPTIWGPSFWFTIHNGICTYPISASLIQKERMKGFILGIPVMLPCEICKVHATHYIDDIKKQLDIICSGRDSLFKWSVDFHNSVNKRNNKKELSQEEARKIYQY